MSQTIKTKVLAFLPAVILLAFWTAGSFIAGQQTPAPAAQAQSFDHSNCQYPDRTTNPPNGCDNSDPCDPANVKGGSGDCVAVPEDKAPVSSPSLEPAPATSKGTAGSCGQ